MSRRSKRAAAAANKPASNISPSVRRGLHSLIQGNEATLLSMLQKEETKATSSVNAITTFLEQIMSMNQLSVEMLLARFFDAPTLLAPYCADVLQKSSKGSAATLAARIAREWSKPTFLAEQEQEQEKPQDDSSSKKSNNKRAKTESAKENDENDEDDWRTPLFFWRGTLIHNSDDKKPNKCRLKWSGSWFAKTMDKKGGSSEVTPPTEADYESTKDNGFSLQGIFGKKEDTASETQSSGMDPFLGLTGNWKGFYMLDQGGGSGHQKCKDLKHDFAVLSSATTPRSGNSTSSSETNPTTLLVAAKGDTDFGAFVSLGHMEEIETATVDGEGKESSIVLTLARRYIDDTDSRNALATAQDVLDSAPLEDIRAGEVPFWKGLPVKG